MIQFRNTLLCLWMMLCLITVCRPSVEPTQSFVQASATPTKSTVSVNAPLPSFLNSIDLSSIPQVDKSQHIVPLEEIYFDTFQRVNWVVPVWLPVLVFGSLLAWAMKPRQAARATD